MKKIILTESQFNRLIKETVRDILNEDSTYTQLVNTFGKDFDEEWNVSSETEQKEELEDEIYKATAQLAGGNPGRNTVMFRDLVEMLQRKFNFTYVGADDERECHVFENGQYTLTVFPVYYYENQGEIRIANMYIM